MYSNIMKKIQLCIILFLFVIIYFRGKSYERLTSASKKRLMVEDDFVKMENYINENLCKKKGYGYDKNWGGCKHIKESTCIRDHPGYITNPEDIELFNKYKESPCTQQLESFDPQKSEVGEWLKATEEDKKKLEQVRKEHAKIVEENKVFNPETQLELFKSNARLFRAERDGTDRCQFSDQSFKRWCIKNKLKYTPHKDGIGKCEITERFCKSKIMNYDKEKKDCYKKDSIAESLFGATLVRSVQARHGDQDVWDCKVSPCYKDEWCAGAGICKPITNPGQSCWSGHNESCWCKSICKTPFNSQAVEEVGVIVGAVFAAVGVAALTVASFGAGLSLAGLAYGLAATAVAMSTGAMAVRAVQLSLEAARCSAGKDGKNIPGGKNGDKSYMALGEPGCCDWYHCPPEHYCPIGNGNCKKALDPGSLCLSGQHSWCKGGSSCKPFVNPLGIAGSIAGGMLAVVSMGAAVGVGGAAVAATLAVGKCSAGKDGKTPAGKQYKKVCDKPKETFDPNPRFKKQLEEFNERDDIKYDKQFMGNKGMIRPPNQLPPECKDVFVKDNGNKQYMALGVSGCGASFPCPPGYYCPFGAGPCKKAKNPGDYCLAGQDSWCRGRSKCDKWMSKCTCGKDGINGPGPLYYKDHKGKDIIEKGMIYDNGNEHFVCLKSIGCDITHVLNKPPPGYYCKSAFNTPREARNPGQLCLAGQHKWCKGGSKCVLGGWGTAKCMAGEDGVNPAKQTTTYDYPKVVEEEYTWKGHKLKIKYDKRFLEPEKVLNKQVGTGNYMPLGEKGCSAVATCPPNVKKGNETEHYHCKVSWEECKPPIEAGKYCLGTVGMDHWCKEKRCKGSVCSTKIANKWYSPIGGTCWAGADPCEADTYCKPGLFKGTCTFG